MKTQNAENQEVRFNEVDFINNLENGKPVYGKVKKLPKSLKIKEVKQYEKPILPKRNKYKYLELWETALYQQVKGVVNRIVGTKRKDSEIIFSRSIELIFNRLGADDYNVSHKETWKIIYNITNSVIIDNYRKNKTQKRDGKTLYESDLNGINEENNLFENLISQIDILEVSELSIRMSLLKAIKYICKSNDVKKAIFMDVYNNGYSYKETAKRNNRSETYIRGEISKHKQKIKKLTTDFLKF
jgi:hypothetical protein